MSPVGMPSGFDNQLKAPFLCLWPRKSSAAPRWQVKAMEALTSWILCSVTEHLFQRNTRGLDVYLEPDPRSRKDNCKDSTRSLI
jgi:hypothetical protein